MKLLGEFLLTGGIASIIFFTAMLIAFSTIEGSILLLSPFLMLFCVGLMFGGVGMMIVGTLIICTGEENQ